MPSPDVKINFQRFGDAGRQRSLVRGGDGQMKQPHNGIAKGHKGRTIRGSGARRADGLILMADKFNKLGVNSPGADGRRAVSLRPGQIRQVWLLQRCCTRRLHQRLVLRLRQQLVVGLRAR